jgi:hypothetical protein
LITSGGSKASPVGRLCFAPWSFFDKDVAHL